MGLHNLTLAGGRTHTSEGPRSRSRPRPPTTVRMERCHARPPPRNPDRSLRPRTAIARNLTWAATRVPANAARHPGASATCPKVRRPAAHQIERECGTPANAREEPNSTPADRRWRYLEGPTDGRQRAVVFAFAPTICPATPRQTNRRLVRRGQ